MHFCNCSLITFGLQIGHLFKILYGFLARGDAHMALADAKNSVLLVCNFLRVSFSQPRDQGFSRVLTSLFNSLTPLLTDADGDSAEAIPALHAQFSRSCSHLPAFKALLMRPIELELYDAAPIAKLIRSEFSPTALPESRIRELHTGNFGITPNELVADFSMSSTVILEALTRHESERHTSRTDHGQF
jgi:hypothetical protein